MNNYMNPYEETNKKCLEIQKRNQEKTQERNERLKSVYGEEWNLLGLFTLKTFIDELIQSGELVITTETMQKIAKRITRIELDIKSDREELARYDNETVPELLERVKKEYEALEEQNKILLEELE